MRCHNTLVRQATNQAKMKDAKDQEKNPQRWKSKVLRLLPPATGNRDGNLVKHYSGELERFSEEFTSTGKILLPKNRFKKHHHFWDGWESSDASSEFNHRLDDQSSDHEDSDGQCQVWTKDNTKLVSNQGLRTVSSGGGNASGGVAAHGGGGPGSGDGNGEHRPRRGRELGAEGSRRRSRTDRDRRRRADAADESDARASRRRSHSAGDVPVTPRKDKSSASSNFSTEKTRQSKLEFSGSGGRRRGRDASAAGSELTDKASRRRIRSL